MGDDGVVVLGVVDIDVEVIEVEITGADDKVVILTEMVACVSAASEISP